MKSVLIEFGNSFHALVVTRRIDIEHVMQYTKNHICATIKTNKLVMAEHDSKVDFFCHGEIKFYIAPLPNLVHA